MRYIYALVDPRDNTVRYVGQTDDMKRRYSEHTNRIESTTKGAWIQELRALNLKPSLVQLDTCDDQAQANYLESWWIILGRRQGWGLVNGTNPGEWRAADDFRALFADELMRMYQEHKTACERLSTEVIALAVERTKIEARQEIERIEKRSRSELELANQRVHDERMKWVRRACFLVYSVLTVCILLGSSLYAACAWLGRTPTGQLDSAEIFANWMIAVFWLGMLSMIYVHHQATRIELEESKPELKTVVSFAFIVLALMIFGNGIISIVELGKLFA